MKNKTSKAPETAHIVDQFRSVLLFRINTPELKVPGPLRVLKKLPRQLLLEPDAQLRPLVGPGVVAPGRVHDLQARRDRVHREAKRARLAEPKVGPGDVGVPPVCREAVHGLERVAPQEQRRLVAHGRDGLEGAVQDRLRRAVRHLPDEPGEPAQRRGRDDLGGGGLRRGRARRERDGDGVLLDAGWHGRGGAALAHVDGLAPEGRRRGVGLVQLGAEAGEDPPDVGLEGVIGRDPV